MFVKLLILSAHVEQNLRQKVLDFGFFVVLHLCQLVSLESCMKNFNELDESVVWKILVQIDLGLDHSIEHVLNLAADVAIVLAYLVTEAVVRLHRHLECVEAIQVNLRFERDHLRSLHRLYHLFKFLEHTPQLSVPVLSSLILFFIVLLEFVETVIESDARIVLLLAQFVSQFVDLVSQIAHFVERFLQVLTLPGHFHIDGLVVHDDLRLAKGHHVELLQNVLFLHGALDLL